MNLLRSAFSMESLSSFGGKRLVGLWSTSRAYGTSRVALLPLLLKCMQNTIIQCSQFFEQKLKLQVHEYTHQIQ